MVRLAGRMKIAFLLLLSVLAVLITLGCLQRLSDSSTKEINPVGMRMHTDRDVYEEPFTINIENKTIKIGEIIKIKPKSPESVVIGPVNLSDDNKSLPYVKVGPIKPTRVKCDISEEEVLRRALQNEDIKEFAEGKDLIFLIFPSKFCDKFYVDTRDLQKPDDTLRLYFYYPESNSFILKGWKSASPMISKTYEMISEEEARKYNVSLNAKNRIYIKCVTSANGSIVGIKVVGIGWNDSVSLNGFEVSKAEVVQSVFIKSLGWSAGRDYVWIVRNK